MGLSIAYASSIVSGYPIIGIDVHEEKIRISKKIWNNACVQCKDKNLNEKIHQVLDNSRT